MLNRVCRTKVRVYSKAKPCPFLTVFLYASFALTALSLLMFNCT